MAPPTNPEAPAAVLAATPPLDPQVQKEAEEQTELNRLKTRTQIDALDLAVTTKHFIKDSKTDSDGVESGTVTFEKFPHLAKVVGLKHLLKPELAFVRVRTPSDEIFEGTRAENGNFYTADGVYIAVWDNYKFEASAKALPEQSTNRELAASPTPDIKTQTALPPPEISSTTQADAAREAAPEKTSKLDKTIFFGDSLTNGMMLNSEIKNSLIPPHERKEYTDKFGNKKIREVGAVVSGQSTGRMLEAIKMAETKGDLDKAEQVVIFGGVNNLAGQETPEQTMKNLRAMYSIANNAGKKIVACTLSQWGTQAFINRWNAGEAKKHEAKIAAKKIPAGTPPPKYPLSADELDRRTAELNRLIIEESKKAEYQSFTVVDLATATLDTKKFPRGGDQLHFTTPGSKNLAQYIMQQSGITSNQDTASVA